MFLLITSFVRSAMLLLVGGCVGVQVLQAQAFIHRTPDEYLKLRTYDPTLPIGEPVGEFVDLYPVFGQWTLFFLKDSVEHKVKCKDIWGFTYKGILFRITDEGPIPVRLMTEGQVCYYENGVAHLKMQRDNVELAEYEIGQSAYISKDISSPIVPARFKDGDQRSISGRFREEHPELEALCICIGATEDMDRTRQCVVDFEAGLEVNR
jgi:hypothetical protein